VLERFRIAQVSPYAWEDRHDVNAFVRETSERLVERDHEVVVVAPSHSSELVHASRNAIRGDEVSLDGLRVLGVGEVLPFRSARRPASVPVDVARTIEGLLDKVAFDFVHVHEPFAPSVPAAALRQSRALNVGSFHAPTERLISTQVARRVVELFFGRLDARTAAWPTTQELMGRWFPAPYELIRPGTPESAPHVRSAPVEIAFVADEERAAQRLFLRALRRLPMALPWRATLIADEWRTRPLLRRNLADRVRFHTGAGTEALDWADVMVFASSGIAPAPSLLRSAVAAQVAPVASRLPLYEGILEDGERGLLFEPGDIEILVAQLTRLIEEPDELDRFARPGPRRPWSAVVDELEELYDRVSARRHDSRANGDLRGRLASRPLIDVDLHMHTDHSSDCATPVEALLGEAKARGLGAIAVTDHNEISGALEAREKADGIKVIVGEEVKTADQGEVIGLFIEEKIPRGVTLQEVDRRDQAPGRARLRPAPVRPPARRARLRAPARRARRRRRDRGLQPARRDLVLQRGGGPLRRKYRIVGGAGSDAHVHSGLGSVRIRMRDFDGPRGVPRVAARRRHHPQAGFARVRAGAASSSRPRPPRRARARGQERRSPGERRGAASLMHAQEKPPHGLKPVGVPATDDEIREKYLERAIRELNTLTRELQACDALSARQPDAGARLGHPQADVFLLKYAPAPAEVEEGVAFYGRAGRR
jgi:glycosyltransferase involved in cell wall biosynthesis